MNILSNEKKLEIIQSVSRKATKDFIDINHLDLVNRNNPFDMLTPENKKIFNILIHSDFGCQKPHVIEIVKFFAELAHIDLTPGITLAQDENRNSRKALLKPINFACVYSYKQQSVCMIKDKIEYRTVSAITKKGNYTNFRITLDDSDIRIPTEDQLNEFYTGMEITKNMDYLFRNIFDAYSFLQNNGIN